MVRTEVPDPAEHGPALLGRGGVGAGRSASQSRAAMESSLDSHAVTRDDWGVKGWGLLRSLVPGARRLWPPPAEPLGVVTRGASAAHERFTPILPPPPPRDPSVPARSCHPKRSRRLLVQAQSHAAAFMLSPKTGCNAGGESSSS